MTGTPVHGLVDRGGRLVAADPPLAALQQDAGGRIGDALALPPIASLARLVRRLGIPISRPVSVADGLEDLHLFVRAAPDAEGVSLAIASWQNAAPPPARRQPAGGIRAAADWTWEADAGLVFTALSPQARWRLGQPADQLVGQPIAQVFRLIEAGGELPLLSGLATQSRVDGQLAQLRASPRHVYRLAAQPVLDPDGHFGGFRGTAVRLEEMPDPIAARTEPPAVVSGDRLGAALKAPLDRIVRQAEAIGSGEAGPLRRDYLDYAADIGGAARHLMALVDDLLDLEAVERPDFTPLRESIDLAEIARQAIGLFAVRAGDAGIILVRPDPQGRAVATGEHRRVLQVAVNILGNAVRHAPAGSRVTVAVGHEEARAWLAVADEGSGIPFADQARVFDKFVRLDPGTSEGSGLGLHISRRLARAMGGDLVLESAPGSGARFTLWLPLGPD